MQQWFLALIARIKGSHSVAVAVADFHKAVTKLESVADFHNELARIHTIAEQKAAAAKAFAIAEEAKAQALLTKFRDFLNV